MNDKDYYLDFHGYIPGTPEAEEAWARKVEMMQRPQKAPMGFVQRDVCYDSPIDGRAITNKHARIEDMRRAGCVEYDPGMRQDYERRIEREQASLEAKVEETVDREIASMPAVKKERLQAEMEGGLTAEPVRRSTDATTTVPTRL